MSVLLGLSYYSVSHVILSSTPDNTGLVCLLYYDLHLTQRDALEVLSHLMTEPRLQLHTVELACPEMRLGSVNYGFKRKTKIRRKWIHNKVCIV